jgi:hypothetical protein
MSVENGISIAPLARTGSPCHTIHGLQALQTRASESSAYNPRQRDNKNTKKLSNKMQHF